VNSKVVLRKYNKTAHRVFTKHFTWLWIPN